MSASSKAHIDIKDLGNLLTPSALPSAANLSVLMSKMRPEAETQGLNLR